MKIAVDRSVCAGHALCALRAPRVYVLDEDGYCASDGQVVPPGLEDEARQGAANCPERAIDLVEEPG
jgi:ferredoxin